LRLWAVRRWKY